jgi:hypothetical protein
MSADQTPDERIWIRLEKLIFDHYMCLHGTPAETPSDRVLWDAANLITAEELGKAPGDPPWLP